MSKTQDQNILVRLSTELIAATDQVLKEKVKDSKANRSEFIRRSLRYTIENIDDFLASDSSRVQESLPIESIAKINAVRDLWDEIYKYTEVVMSSPDSSLSDRRMVFLIRLLGQMIFRMND
jgi:metal-responsive CopG/Arc/MetJ family transcriptional regulator